MSFLGAIVLDKIKKQAAELTEIKTLLLQPTPGLASHKLGQKDHYIWALCSDRPGSDIYSAWHDMIWGSGFGYFLDITATVIATSLPGSTSTLIKTSTVTNHPFVTITHHATSTSTKIVKTTSTNTMTAMKTAKCDNWRVLRYRTLYKLPPASYLSLIPFKFCFIFFLSSFHCLS